MELHVVHINRVYRTQELALKENDGVAILIYLFQVRGGRGRSSSMIH